LGGAGRFAAGSFQRALVPAQPCALRESGRECGRVTPEACLRHDALEGMTIRFDVLLAILGMALATYLLRAGGYALLRATRPPPFVQAMLACLPGCIFVAFVTPALVAGGPRQLIAAACVAGVMLATRSYVLAILGGVAALWLITLAPL
jgi:uncharacterized membrane protein